MAFHPITLVSTPEDGRHDARMAASVHNGKNPQRTFVRSVGNQVVAHAQKAQRTESEIGPSMPHAWRFGEPACCVEDFAYDSVGSVDVVGPDEVPDLVEVLAGFWMKGLPGHQSARGSPRAAALFSRKCVSTSSPDRAFTRPLFRSS